jgi:hypothetical protein
MGPYFELASQIKLRAKPLDWLFLYDRDCVGALL